MKKGINLIVLILILSVSCKTDEVQKNDLIKLGLNGDVMSISEFKYEVVEKFGEIQKGELISRDFYSYFDFDINGFITEGSYESDLDSKYILKYNEEGDVDEKNLYYSDGSLYQKHTYQYDEKGNLIVKNINEDGNIILQCNFKYDDYGNNIEEISQLPNGITLERYLFKYNEEGKLVKEKRFFSDNTIGHEFDFKYNDKGILLQEKRSFPEGKPKGKTVYFYDDRGNLIQEKNNSFGLEQKSVFKYDDNMNLIESEYYGVLGKLSSKTNYEYDKRGNLLKEITKSFKTDGTISEGITEHIFDKNDMKIGEKYSSEGKLIRKHKFEYDKNSNLIKNTKYNTFGSVGWKTTYSYDNKENMIEENHYGRNGKLKSKKVYIYDNNGNKTEMTPSTYPENFDEIDKILEDIYMLRKETYEYKDGVLVTETTFNSDGSVHHVLRNKYNNSKQKIERVQFESSNSKEDIVEYKYEYDSSKNWVKRIDNMNNIPENIIIRKVKYFK